MNKLVCPECKAKMEDTFNRVSVNSKSVIEVRCKGDDEGFHSFRIFKLSELVRFLVSP